MRTICMLLLLSVAFASVCASFNEFTNAAYQSQSRQKKQSQLWSKITENTNSGSYPSSLGLGGIFLESMSTTIDRVSDVLPFGRTKYIHSVGSVLTASFTPVSNSPYTGFFEGADSLIIRISLAKNPDYSNPSASAAYDNFTPGHGLKYLINGKPSANLVAMHSVNGVDTFNPFESDFETHIPGAKGVALSLVAEKFSSATKVIQNVGLKTLAATKQDGTPVASPQYPWKLVFRARPNVKAMFTEDYTVDYKTVLSTIPVGTVLYDVLAVADPSTNCEELIGSITTTSVPTPSKFGDEKLFFQHSDFQLDLKDHPEWAPFTPFWNGFFNHDAAQTEGDCPFSNLWK